MGITTILGYIVSVLYWVIILLFVLTVLYERKDPARTLSWIVVIILIPVVGIIFYIFFGKSFRRKWILNHRELRELEYIEKYYKSQIRSIEKMEGKEIENNQQVIRLLLNNSRSLITKNNKVDILTNGQTIFDQIIETIKSAQKSIHLEYYIIDHDELAESIANILIDKAKQGVKVRIIYDEVGSWKLKKSFIKKLRANGIEITCFFPVAFPWLSSRLNNRNHRKIAIIDSKIAFTGGINIAKRYLSTSWHDTNLKIQGPAVNMLQITFMTDWNYATKQIIENWREYIYQNSSNNGDVALQIAVSGPDAPWASIMQAYFEIITKARKSIFISTPYFTPTQPILTALKVAALGGIDIRLMLPAKGDVLFADLATRSYFQELLEAGIKIFLYKNGFIHTKMICVDDDICSIGSVNMDERSFEDNYEITAFMYNKSITEKVKSLFAEDCEQCTLLTLRTHRYQSNFMEAIARLLSPLL